jgi:hypothetical protein
MRVVEAMCDCEVISVKVNDGHGAPLERSNKLTPAEVRPVADLQAIGAKDPNYLMDGGACAGGCLQLGLQQPVRPGDAEVPHY